ncbi:hypothetical protein [Streptomyces halstedii]|uniref:hypothetical protein n=1 Tax=Streptomyces halstedii TaxID=1944 RepID=UPI0036B3CECA
MPHEKYTVWKPYEQLMPASLSSGAQAAREALAVGEDDGRDVFAHLSRDWKEIRTWARSLL